VPGKKPHDWRSSNALPDWPDSHGLPPLPEVPTTRRRAEVAPWDCTRSYIATLGGSEREKLLRSYQRQLKRNTTESDGMARWRRDWLARAIGMLEAAQSKPIGGKTPRQGYREAVKAWMKANETVEEAARRLGVSKSTLKSIMSAKGKARYGADTIERVLSHIRATPKSA